MRDGSWVVPPLRAVWVPPLTTHSIRMTGAVEMRTVDVARPIARTLPDACCVVPVTPLLRALEHLATGESVTTVALDLGYEGPSAFIAMFRKALGVSPSRYFRAGP